MSRPAASSSVQIGQERPFRSAPTSPKLKTTFLIVLSLLAAQSVGRTAPPNPPPSGDALRFFRNYFVTGDYAVASIGMRAMDGTSNDLDNVAGVVTRQLSMSLPDNGDDKVILAAFLYWQTIVSANQGSGTNGVLFRGEPITAGSPALTTAELLNPQGTTPCWSNGGAAGPADGTKNLQSYRTDVLGLLPRALIDHDEDPNTPSLPIGERVVDDDALLANGYPLTTVTMPSSSSGNQVPLTNGVSLVVIYRDEKPGAQFRGISIYDGGFSLDQQHEAMTQTIRGFYQASTGTPAARLTQIVGDGQSEFSERVQFNGATIAGGETGGPFIGLSPRWDEYTVNVSLPPGAASATVKVDHNKDPNDAKFTPYDCLSWSAILFSTVVQDADSDGLLDVWELNSSKGPNPLTDPNGVPLPPLGDMGASVSVKDMFFQMDFMSSRTEDGGFGPYFTPTEGSEIDPIDEHRHLPDYGALKMVGDAFKNAPGSAKVQVHFDLGSDIYQTTNLVENGNTYNPLGDGYIIPNTTQVKGGEPIAETRECTVAENNCAFPGFFGVVGWKSAFLRYRDEVINAPETLPIGTNAEEWCIAREPGGASFNATQPSTWCQRRFDRIRLPMFRYVLWAHFLGRPQKDDPATPADESRYPRKNSGIADFPGGDLMMALGGFVDVRTINGVQTPTYNASTVTQASTLMHEIGHTVYLGHGGWGGQGHQPGADPPLPNCRPNYLSVMNYLFQLPGLVRLDGSSAIDYERSSYGPLDENNLKENVGLALLSGTRMYRTRWNAFRYDTTALNPAPPLGSIHNGSFLDAQLHTTPLRRHCNGTPIEVDAQKDPGINGPTATLGYDSMVRVEGGPTTTSIDWDADTQNDAGNVLPGQDLSFNGTKSTLEASTSDWGKLQLQQLGSRRNAANASIGAMSVGFFLNEQGPAGDEGVGDEGVGDEGVGDEGVGDEGVGDEGVGDEGVGDEGVGDEGVGDEGVGDEPSVDDGLHSPPPFATAQSLRTGIRITWGKPPVGVVDKYNVYRVETDRNGVPFYSTLTTVLGSPILPTGSNIEPVQTIDDTTAAQSKYYIYLVNAEVRPSLQAPAVTTVVTSYRVSNVVRR
jgi:hypothetical protein